MSDSEFADELIRQGWCVQPGFLSDSRVAELGDVAREHWTRGNFHKAGIGRGAAHSIRHAIRGDHVLWLDECEAPVVQGFVSHELEMLRRALNIAGYLGLHEFEGHFAVYPPATGYAQHLDRFRDSDARVVSLVLYLNQDWQPADGGELRLYPGAEVRNAITVTPTGGTLVGFLSAELPHEVLPSRCERFSLSGWFRRRS
ncbi:MAG TPA: 2OG-Fe(II) oxygenase [Gammaproteobacteria bacterium]|nr:2OG-Fe(II) oxygenase [Gammaproteobacteria bacterium]